MAESPWVTWCRGLLTKLGAPSRVAAEAAWAWSCAESWNGLGDPLSQLMRWNNPLNSTLRWPGSVNSPAQPSRPVQIYASVQDGIDATYATLTDPNLGLFPNGYDVICGDLRSGLSYHQWQNASHQLGLWGTGIGWLARTFPPAPLVFAFSSSGGDGTMVELFRPDRADAVLVGRDGNIYHLSAPDDETLNVIPTIHGFDTGTIKAVPGTLGAKWSRDNGSIIVSWAGTDQQVYRGAIYGNGTMARQWVAVTNAKAALPGAGVVQPPPPPAPVDDDSSYATTADLAHHVHLNDGADAASAKTGPAILTP